MKKIVFFIIFISANLVFLAQTPKKWKKVTPDEFTYINTDSSVHAVILFEQAKYRFDVWNEELKLFVEVHKRILILDTVGLNYAKLEIPYYAYRKYDEFASFKANYYFLSNGKVKRKSLKNNQISDVEINDYWNKKTANFGVLKPGTIIEYKYVLTTLNMVEPPKWYFQHEIPCLYSSFTLNVPKVISYQMRINGVNFLSENSKRQAFTNLNYTLNYDDPIPGGSQYRNQSFNAPINLSLKSWLFNTIMTDIPPYKSVQNTDCDCNHKRSLTLNLNNIDQKHELTSGLDLFAWEILTQRLYQATTDNYVVKRQFSTTTVNNPAGYIVFHISDWNELDAKLKKNYNFGIQLLKAWNFRPELNAALQNSNDSALNKTIAIYNYVQTNYEWNGMFSIYTSDDLSKISTTKTGNTADINLMLVYLLKKAGIDAYPVLIRTKNSGYVDYDWASPRQFNNVIACAEINGKRYFLDAKDKNIPWNVLNPQNSCNEGRIINGLESEFVPITANYITNYSHSFNIYFSQNIAQCSIKMKDGGLEGNYKRNNFDSWLNNYKKLLNNPYNFLISTDSLSNFSEPLETEISFSIDNYLSTNKIYPFDFFEINYFFSSPIRNIPVYFDEKFEKNFFVEIKIPNGKHVISTPDDILNTIYGAYVSTITTIDSSSIKIHLRIGITEQLFEPIYYSGLRLFFAEIDRFINSPVVIE